MKLMNKWRKPFSILTVIAVVAVGGATWFTNVAHAAGGQIYTTVGSNTVTPGGTVTVNVRINPSTPTDTVNVILTYPSTMTYANISYAGSPFDQHFGLTTGGGQVSFAAAMLGTSVSTDSFIATVTFTAATGSTGTGTASFSLSGSNAASGGTPTNPTIGTASTVSFVCASGQTGTPPNCTTPTSGGSNGGTGSTGGTGNTGGSKTTTPPPSSTSTSKTGTSSGTSAGGTGSTSTQTVKPQGTPASVTDQNVQYTKVSITCTTKTAATAYIRYGINGNLTSNTPVSPISNTHTIVLDPTTLLPGTTYSYVVVSTDANGTVSQTAVQTFKTKGIQVTLTLTDSNHKPLKNQTVTLHSDPMTGKTDDKGNVTFSDVPTGAHQVIYVNGKKTYTQAITVVNDIQTVGEAQTAEPQTFSVVYDFAQSTLNMLWVWLGIIVLIVIVLAVLGQTGHLGFAMQMRTHEYAAPISAPVVVGSNTTSPHEVGNNSMLNDEQRASVQEHLNAIPNPSQPVPGTSLAPRDDSSSNDQVHGQE